MQEENPMQKQLKNYGEFLQLINGESMATTGNS